MSRDKLDEARRTFERVLTLSGTDALALTGLSDVPLRRGALDDVARLNRRCIQEHPRATICLENLMEVLDIRGQCREQELLAQRLIALTPNDPWGYIGLFESQVAQGVPAPPLDPTVARIVAHAGKETRAWAKIRYAWLEAIWAGDFPKGTTLLDDEEALALQLEDLEDELYVARDRIAIGHELDDTATQTRAAAESYLLKKLALRPVGSANRDALARDATRTILRTLLRAHAISAEAFNAQLAAWLAGWQSRISMDDEANLWVEGYARGVETPAEAERAVAAMPAGVDAMIDGAFVETEAIGRVYLLAGRADRALPFLERAATSCSTRRRPFEIPRARYFLGRAREKTGNRDGACAAYQTTLDVWGKAKPRPAATADLAHARTKALQCK